MIMYVCAKGLEKKWYTQAQLWQTCSYGANSLQTTQLLVEVKTAGENSEISLQISMFMTFNTNV